MVKLDYEISEIIDKIYSIVNEKVDDCKVRNLAPSISTLFIVLML